MREFAKASLVKLIHDRLSQTHPHLLQGGPGKVDPIRQAHAPAGHKRALLDRLLDEAGAGEVVALGQSVAGGGPDPIWAAAVNSASPAVLFDKWQRFESFAHWNNRLRIERPDDTGAVLHRYAVNGAPPTDAENLFVCGLMTGLLAAIGCQGLECRMGGLAIVPRCLQAPEQSDRWEISWTAFRPNAVAADNGEAQELGLQGSAKAALALLLQDAARQWSLAELAGACAMSTRTLQRRLAENGLSFGRLVRLARVHVSCRMLEETDLPLTVIAFCTGFSDSAHFSRDFAASTGIAPSRYRGLALPKV